MRCSLLTYPLNVESLQMIVSFWPMDAQSGLTAIHPF
jgi:hypothetical protein